MNSILTFLSNNRQRLGLEQYDVPANLTSVLITPRFHASSHVVFLVLPEDRPEPILVAKVPRLAGAGETLEREVANLQAVQASRDGGFDSIPRVIAFEKRWERPILVETALIGQPLDPPTIRRDSDGACQTITNWLSDVQLASCESASPETGWFERLIAIPLSHLETSVALSNGEGKLLAQTWRLAETLRDMELPLVVEHGDLSHPNLILREDGSRAGYGAGVVDWELADLQGLPACDLFFFLTYVAFALHGTRENGRYVQAFHNAYFGSEAWAYPYVRRYAERIELPPQALKPLFVLTWARYLAGLLVRLDKAAPQSRKHDPETAAWLRSNRYYALWRHATEHLEEFNWQASQED